MSSWHSKRPQSPLKLNFNVFIDTSYDISKHMGYKLLPCTPCVYSNPHIKTNSAFPDDFISFCWLTCPCLLKLLLRVFFNIQHFWNIKPAICRFHILSKHFAFIFMGTTWPKSSSSIFLPDLWLAIWVSHARAQQSTLRLWPVSVLELLPRPGPAMGGSRSSALTQQLSQRRFSSDLRALEVGLSCSKGRFSEPAPLPVRNDKGSSSFLWPGLNLGGLSHPRRTPWLQPPRNAKLPGGSSSGLQQGFATLRGSRLVKWGQERWLSGSWKQRASRHLEVDAVKSLETTQLVNVCGSGLRKVSVSNSEPGRLDAPPHGMKQKHFKARCFGVCCPYKAWDRPRLLVLAPRPFQQQTSLVVPRAAAPTSVGERDPLLYQDPLLLMSPDRPSGKQSREDMLILAMNKSTGEGSKKNQCLLNRKKGSKLGEISFIL